MAANKKFTPRASSNLIEEEVTDVVDTPVEEDITSETPVEDSVTETEVDTPVENNEVTFTAETEKKPIEKMVKIRLAKKYDGCVGGVWYHFAKDQTVTVPESIKFILNSIEGMLKPL